MWWDLTLVNNEQHSTATPTASWACKHPLIFLLGSIQIRFLCLILSLQLDALILCVLASNRCGELGCMQSQYLCRGSLPLAAIYLTPLCSPSTIYSSWHTVVPMQAHLQQLSELWTLKRESFFPLAFICIIMLPTFAVQGRSKVQNWLSAFTAIRWASVYSWKSPEAMSCLDLLISFISTLSGKCLNISRIFVCLTHKKGK